MKTRNEIINETIENISASKARSAWTRGVKAYAVELVEALSEALQWYAETGENMTRRTAEMYCLNGAKDWSQYSWGGCSLCYNYQIAKRLCNPTELKTTDNGNRKPNAREEWLDTQARALYQAFLLLWECYPKEAKA